MEYINEPVDVGVLNTCVLDECEKRCDGDGTCGCTNEKCHLKKPEPWCIEVKKDV